MSGTRVKDLVDLVLIVSTESVVADALRQALQETLDFGMRHRTPVCARLGWT
ncbi:MAG: hypothetical protein HY332_08450 [Chloroflexi bacterium]|nr:hypothetical protein [Chloroflexota bacterium]